MVISSIPTPPPIAGYLRFLERRYRHISDNQGVKNNWEPKKFDLWDLRELIDITRQWLAIAKEHSIDTLHQIDSISSAIVHANRLKDPLTQKIDQLAVNHLMYIIGLNCNQVIREVAFKKISTLAQEGRKSIALKSKEGLINLCEKWAVKQLPNNKTFQSPKKTEEQCKWVLEKVEQMRQKVLSSP